MLTALLLTTGLASASLVLELRPGDYQTSTNAWPIANGSLAGSYFQCAAPYVSVTSKIYTNNALGYHGVDFTAGNTIMGGPLCPASLGGANPKTIEAWVFQPASANGDAGTILDLYCEYQATDSEFALCDSLYPNPGRALYDHPGTIQGWTTPFSGRSGNWVYLVASYDGANLNLYINGVLDKTVPYTYNTVTGSSIAIGCLRYAPATTPQSTANEDGWNNWRGYMGGIRVYDEARSGSQVATDYGLGVNYGEVGAGLPGIVATAGTGGTISPAGTNAVAVGANQAFVITPTNYYDVSSVLVNGSTQVVSGADQQTYTISNITANGTIAASFTAWAVTNITGTVTFGGNPLAGAVVTATGHRGPFTGTSAGDGTYSIKVRPGDSYTVTAFKSGYTMTPASLSPAPGSLTGQNFAATVITLTNLVNLDASTLTAGTLSSWTNTGAVGGSFYPQDASHAPTVTTIAGKQAVYFYQPDSSAASRETLTNTVAAPTAISGGNAWTISATLYSTNLNYVASENAYFCWAGSSQGAGTCAEFDYYSGQAYFHQDDGAGHPLGINGSFTHVPSANAWHNVTITYDGAIQTIYVDGAIDSTQAMLLNLAPNNMMMVGGRYWHNGDPTQDQYWRLFSAYIANINIYNLALTASQVNLLSNPTHTITPSAGNHGTISPNTAQVVSNYLNSTFTYTPTSGYVVSQLLVDGVNTAATAGGGTYTFTNVIANHTIAVTFISASLDTNEVVLLDASALTPGPLASWGNDGTIGGTFNAYSSTNEPTVENVSGRLAVHFVQPDSSAASRQTLVNTVNAPASLSGSNPWTIAADLYSTNLNVGGENAYFCWAGSDQGAGTCAEFDYCHSYAYNHETQSGAGPYYLSGGFANVPSANAWHNVTITYDGTTQTIYVDGAYDSSQTMSLSLATNNLLMVGSRYWHTGDPTQDQYWRLANASIGKLQVFSKALTAGQVASMFSPLTFPISGTVTVGGSPVAGVTVTLAGAGVYTTTTDGSGNYSVAVLVGSTNSPSPYTVTASGVGYSTSSTNVNVLGAALTGVNLALTLQDVLVGTVKTSGGAPIYNAIVQVGGSNGVFTVSGLDGTYRIGGIPINSSVELYAKGLGYAFSISTINTTAAATGVVTNNIVLTPQAATGVISNGGFEIIDSGSGIPSAWHDWAGYNCPDAGGNYVGGLGDDYISATTTAGDVYSGTYAAEYNPTLYASPSGSYTFLWQDVPVTNNSTYNVYWKMKCDANVAAHVFCIVSFRNTNNTANEHDMFSYAGGASTNWTQYPSASPTGQDAAFTPGQATRFAVPAGVNVVNVLLGVDDSYTGPALYFDDVVVDRNDISQLPVTFTITATNGAGGTISPSGAVMVNSGGSQTFTITPSGPAYAINQVLVDGVNNRGAVTGGHYTFTGVSANHSIGASFTYTPPTAPSFQPVSIQSGNLVLRTATSVGYNYYLLQTTNLHPPVVWTTNTITAGTGGIITNSPPVVPGQPNKFYRFMAQ